MPFPRPFPLLVSLAVALVCGLNASPAHAQSTDFPKPFDTQDTKAQPLTSPEEALKKIRLPDGFKATLFAAEPDVQNPIAMAFDTRGRLWISENYTYAESSVNFESKLRDRIIILEPYSTDDYMESLWQKRAALYDRPQLIVWGGADKFIGKLHLDRWRSELPRAEVHVLADVGHFPHDEAPDEVGACIERFFANSERSSS